jgi:hypothetical protein
MFTDAVNAAVVVAVDAFIVGVVAAVVDDGCVVVAVAEIVVIVLALADAGIVFDAGSVVPDVLLVLFLK